MDDTWSEYSSDESYSSDEELLQLINMLPKRKVYRTRNDPFELYDETEFKLRYRFSKQSVINLVDIFGINHLKFNNLRNMPVTPLCQFLITLRYYATGSFQQVLGDHINVDKSTVCRIIPRITELIARKSKDFIKMPQTDIEIKRTITDFSKIKSFPRVIGAIDSTHVKIQSPGGDKAELFRNREGWFSLNIQLVCDANLKILDIVSRWPGSVHDSQIFNSSSLRIRFELGEFRNFWLLGDSGYACKPYLLTPILNPKNAAEERYNAAHIITRNPIGRALGVMKRRFPCLVNGIRMKPEKAVNIIVAIAVLHNVALEIADIDLQDDRLQTPEDEFLDFALPSEIIIYNDISNRRALINSNFSR